MDNNVRDWFTREVARTFRFLHEDYGFLEPLVSCDELVGNTTAVLVGRNLAVELLLDERDPIVECKIAAVTDGRPTRFYAVDNKGNRVRESLQSLLLRQGVREGVFRKIGGLDFRHQISATLEDLAEALRKHGPGILNDSLSVLND